VYIPAPVRFQPNAPDLESRLSQLGRVAGAYVLHGAGGPLHLSWSANLERRLRRLISSAYRGTVLLGEKLTAIECWPTGSKLEHHLLLYALARKLYPDSYQTHLKLRLPWFLALTQEPFARVELTNRIRPRFAALWGPFASRGAAEQYEQEVLGLFQIRRCSEALLPDPAHPGCIYGEMNQCLRPCQQAASPEEYAAETGRVREFLANNGRSASASLISARERACEEAEFEQAAHIHKRIERLKSAAAYRDPVIAEAAAFHGVAMTPSSEAGRVTLWPMFAGLWQQPVSLALSDPNTQTKSLDSEIRLRLSTVLGNPRTAGVKEEELALFSRWFYSSWRDGQWYPFGTLEGLNYRKLIRDLSKLAHAPCPLTKK
jgi:excinuclease ABC subunit C